MILLNWEDVKKSEHTGKPDNLYIVEGSVVRRNDKGILIAVISKFALKLTHEKGERYYGIICKDSDKWYNSIAEFSDEDIDLLKLKIDLKLCEMGYKISKPGL